MEEQKPSLNQISFMRELLSKQEYIDETFELRNAPEEIYEINLATYKKILALIYNDKIPANKESLLNNLDLLGYRRKNNV